MAGDINRLRYKLGETEKITINVGYVDLGHIDLLVHEGFYSNRTDFIRTAIRNQLSTHADAVKDVTPELALATIESITVLGALQATKAVKTALSDRFR